MSACTGNNESSLHASDDPCTKDPETTNIHDEHDVHLVGCLNVYMTYTPYIFPNSVGLLWVPLGECKGGFPLAKSFFAYFFFSPIIHNTYVCFLYLDAWFWHPCKKLTKHRIYLKAIACHFYIITFPMKDHVTKETVRSPMHTVSCLEVPKSLPIKWKDMKDN